MRTTSSMAWRSSSSSSPSPVPVPPTAAAARHRRRCPAPARRTRPRAPGGATGRRPCAPLPRSPTSPGCGAATLDAGPSSSMSPLPMSRSAPAWSRITRLSVTDRHREREARRDVRLDHTGDHVDRRTLRRDHEVDADGAGHLRDATDRVLDVAGRHHHEVGQLVDHDEDERQPWVLALGCRARARSSPRSNAAL